MDVDDDSYRSFKRLASTTKELCDFDGTQALWRVICHESLPEEEMTVCSRHKFTAFS